MPHWQPIELPDLARTQFDLSDADLEITVAGHLVQHAQLTLEGGKDVFEHTYEEDTGTLVVRERGDVGSGMPISSGDGKFRINMGNTRVRDLIISGGGNVTINGKQISNPGGGVMAVNLSGERRKALLQVPEGYQIAAHEIKSAGGDATLEGVNARRLTVAMATGSIALRGANVEEVSLKTKTGDIEASDVASSFLVTMTSKSGDITVKDSNAREWLLNTKIGDIMAHGVQGTIDAHSLLGRVSIR